MRGRLGATAALAAALTFGWALPAQALFAPTSYLNRALAANAPLDPASTVMVGELVSQVHAEERFQGSQPTVNTSHCSSPVYVVPADQPMVAVAVVPPRFDSLPQQFASVPIPPDAQPDTSCPDSDMVVYQPSTDREWEFWQAEQTDTGWQAAYGGEIGPELNADGTTMRGVSQNPGYFQDPPLGFGRRFGATATSIPLLAGLQTIAELQAGSIDHAVAFAMLSPAACFRFPAQRQDGDAAARSNLLAPPEGAFLRLPASLNITALNLPPYVDMLARAVQRYGMVLRDRGGTTAFLAEAPQPGAEDPYPAIFGGQSPQHLLESFPWSSLQVLAVPAGHPSCQTA